MLEFVDAVGQFLGGLVDGIAQGRRWPCSRRIRRSPRRCAPNRLCARRWWSGCRRTSRSAEFEGDVLELAVGSEVVRPFAVDGGNPADRTRDHAALEGVEGQAVRRDAGFVIRFRVLSGDLPAARRRKPGAARLPPGAHLHGGRLGMHPTTGRSVGAKRFRQRALDLVLAGRWDAARMNERPTGAKSGLASWVAASKGGPETHVWVQADGAVVAVVGDDDRRDSGRAGARGGEFVAGHERTAVAHEGHHTGASGLQAGRHRHRHAGAHRPHRGQHRLAAAEPEIAVDGSSCRRRWSPRHPRACLLIAATTARRTAPSSTGPTPVGPLRARRH